MMEPKRMTIEAVLWSADPIKDSLSQGIELFFADEQGNSVLVRIDGFFTRPEVDGRVTVSERSSDFVAEAAACVGHDFMPPTF